MIVRKFNNLHQIITEKYVAYITLKNNSISSKCDVPIIYSKKKKNWIIPPIGGDEYERNIYSCFNSGFNMSRLKRKLISFSFNFYYLHIYTNGIIFVVFKSQSVKIFSFPSIYIFKLINNKTEFISVLGFYKKASVFNESI